MRSHPHQPPAVLAGLLLVLLSLHFVMTLGYLLPLNPIKLRRLPPAFDLIPDAKGVYETIRQTQRAT